MSPLLPLVYTQVPVIVLQIIITLNLRAPWNVAACAGMFFVCWTCIQYASRTKIIFIDYQIGMTIAGIAMDAVYMTLLVRPLNFFRHRTQTQSADKLPWFERFKWASTLCASHRGVGWNHQVQNLSVHPTSSRKDFVISRLMTVAKHYLWFDLAQCYIRHNPVYQSHVAFASQVFVSRVLSCGVALVFEYCTCVILYSLIAAVAVGCTSSEPSSWPDVFGKWEDAYSIRRFWGRTWHQMLRRFLVPFGKRTASFLGFLPGTNGSSYTQLYTAFFVSGITHLPGDAMINPSHIGASFPFFIYQALGITFEDMIIAAARRAGWKEGKGTRVLGYMWVASWLAVTATGWVSACGISGLEGGGQMIPSKYFPPSFCDTLFNSLGI